MASSENADFLTIEEQVLTALLAFPEIQKALECDDDEEAAAQVRKCLRTQSLANLPSPSPKRFKPVFSGRILIATWGLQGSGKTALCKMLRDVLGGVWINQDDCAARNPDLRPKEAFLQELRRSIRQKERFIFVDRTNLLRQQRLDILKELLHKSWFERGNRALLCEYVHKEDPIGHGSKDSSVGRRYSSKHINYCLRRIERRGGAHHTFKASMPGLLKFVTRAAQTCERPSPGEQNLWKRFMTINVTLPPVDACLEVLKDLHESGCMSLSPESYKLKLEKSWIAHRRMEEEWRQQEEKENRDAQDAAARCTYCNSVVNLTIDESQSIYCRRCWKQWDKEKQIDNQRRERELDGQEEGEQGPKPLYWQISLPDISKRISNLPANLIPISDPHVTLLYIGGKTDEQAAQRYSLSIESFTALRDALQDLEGQAMKVKVTKIAMEADKLAVAVVEFVDPVPCAQKCPHVTLATADNVSAAYSNALLDKVKDENFESDEVAVVPMPGGGRVFEGFISLKTGHVSTRSHAGCGL